MARSLLSRLRPWLTYWPYAVFATVFVVTRLVYRGAYGLRFDGSPLFYFIQYLDPWFFENDFLRSVLYLHQQAPIPNSVVGVAWLVFGPFGWFYVLDGILVAFGMVLGLALLVALQRVGVNRVVATVVTCVFLATPVAVLYELWLFYHVPVAALLVCALCALFRYYRSGTFRAGLLFFGLLAGVALIRNVYGAVWLGAIAAAVFIVPPTVAPRGSTARRTVLKALAIPMLLLVVNGAKTSFLLGRGYGDAAVWTNIVYKTWPEVPSAERERLKAEKIISDSVGFEPFMGVEALRKLRVKHEPTGVPLLDMPRLPNGRGNTHTLEYLLIADKFYKPDGKYLLEHYPDAYARSVWSALADWYVSSPTRDIVLPQTFNYKRLKKVDTTFNELLLPGENGRLWVVIVLVPILLVYGCYRVLRMRALLASERPIVVGVLYMLLTISYAALGTTMVSSADFSRYRFDVDPFYLILLMMLVSQLGSAVARLVRRRRRRTNRLVGATATA
jgi:hypothetical protein